MQYRFDFDDQLPDLPMAFDLEEVTDLFRRKLLAGSSALGGADHLKVSKLQDLKYRPAHRCVTTYEMVVGKQGAAEEKTIGVLEFTPDGVVPRIYTADD